MRGVYPATLKTSRLILSQEQIDDYMTVGYLRLQNILDKHQIEFFQDEYDKELEKAFREGYITNLAEDNDRTKTEGLQFLGVYRPSTRNIQFQKLGYADNILDVVEDLIGGNIRLLEVLLLYKPPHHGSAVNWHQDNFHYQCFPANMVSGWLPLDDVNEDNGAMEMIPGSHLRPIWEDHVENIDISSAKVVELPAGGMSFHHSQVLHRSAPNKSDRPRRVIVIRFVPIGTQSPRLHTQELSFFVHPILRMRI